jgi:hypothetical protein
MRTRSKMSRRCRCRCHCRGPPPSTSSTTGQADCLTPSTPQRRTFLPGPPSSTGCGRDAGQEQASRLERHPQRCVWRANAWQAQHMLAQGVHKFRSTFLKCVGMLRLVGWAPRTCSNTARKLEYSSKAPRSPLPAMWTLLEFARICTTLVSGHSVLARIPSKVSFCTSERVLEYCPKARILLECHCLDIIVLSPCALRQHVASALRRCTAPFV